MPTITAIAKDWHTSRPYVSRCVNHRGCPTSSLQHAAEWRACYANKRAVITREIENNGDNPSPQDRTLIPLIVARDMAWRGYDTILDLVLELPKNAAVQCNPSNPQIALAALESECTSILCDAGDVYAVWSEVVPFPCFKRNPK
jgi:hypothetical protein